MKLFYQALTHYFAITQNSHAHQRFYQFQSWRVLVEMPCINHEHQVAVDWYTINVPGRVPDENIQALQRLSAFGFKLVVWCWCHTVGPDEVREEAAALPSEWLDMCFCKSKTGHFMAKRPSLSQVWLRSNDRWRWICVVGHQANFKHFPKKGPAGRWSFDIRWTCFRIFFGGSCRESWYLIRWELANDPIHNYS